MRSQPASFARRDGSACTTAPFFGFLIFGGGSARSIGADGDEPGATRRDGVAMRILPDMYWPVSERGFASMSLSVPCRDDVAAVHAGAGSHVDDVVGRADHVLVVLDDEHRVAEVAQVLQRVDQPVVVALVQADRRLVEHVHDAGQARADLRCEPDALRLAARQRLGAALERQVVEADVVQEREPRDDLLDDPLGDLALRARELELLEPVERVVQRHRADLVDRLLSSCPVADRPDAHEARVAPQPRAVAGRARLAVEILRELFLDRDRVGLLVAPLEVRDDALERMLAHDRSAALVDVRERDRLLAGALQDQLADVVRQRLERRVEIEAAVRREALQHLEVELVAPVPALDRARRERQVREADDALRVEELDDAEPVAARTRAHRVVEREQPRLELGERVVADRAREAGSRTATRAPESMSSAIARPSALRSAVSNDSARRCLICDASLPIFSRSITTSMLCFSFFFSFGSDSASTIAPSTRKRTKPCACIAANRSTCSPFFSRTAGARIISRVPSGMREHVVDHLGDALRLQRQLVVRAVRRADPREQQPQVVVDLGDGADRRARVVARRLLLDRDRRRQTFDQVDVGLLHQLQELPRVRRQRLDVAPLAFGVQRVERERRLAGARQAGDDDQLLARQVEIDVLQVVRAGAAYANLVHRRAGLGRCCAARSNAGSRGSEETAATRPVAVRRGRSRRGIGTRNAGSIG